MVGRATDMIRLVVIGVVVGRVVEMVVGVVVVIIDSQVLQQNIRLTLLSSLE